MTLSDQAVFECRDLSVNLDGRPVLKGVSFVLREGEFVALLGDNGAGKTTLVKVLLGLLAPASGDVEIFGVDLPHFRSWRRIGYVPQRMSAASPVPATVGEVVLSGRAAHRLLPGYNDEDRKMATRALEAVKLDGSMDRPVASLSGGQQQRVLIARALSADPEVLILDEPASGIDDESQEALASTLGRLSEEGRSVLMVAHGLGPLASLVSRSLVLDGGEVVYNGPPMGSPFGPGHLHVHHHPEAR